MSVVVGFWHSPLALLLAAHLIILSVHGVDEIFLQLLVWQPADVGLQ